MPHTSQYILYVYAELVALWSTVLTTDTQHKHRFLWYKFRNPTHSLHTVPQPTSPNPLTTSTDIANPTWPCTCATLMIYNPKNSVGVQSKGSWWEMKQAGLLCSGASTALADLRGFIPLTSWKNFTMLFLFVWSASFGYQKIALFLYFLVIAIFW